MNTVLIVSLTAMIIAQIAKVPIYYFKKGIWDNKMVFSTGSMPSSHSAFVVSLTTSVGIVEGYDSTIFAVSCVFMLIILHDAIKVRGESGKQAKVINELVNEIGKLGSLLNIKDNKQREEKLKELIGHTAAEVTMGVVLGISVSLIFYMII
jgi:acid phosphatase family membrane protein YuiD